jgi:hypothetical protein
MEMIESDDPRDTLWFLAGVAAVGLGAAFLFGTQEGRKVRRQLLSWTEEAQRRLADIQEVLEVTRQLCEGELPGEARDLPQQRMRVVTRG